MEAASIANFFENFTIMDSSGNNEQNLSFVGNTSIALIAEEMPPPANYTPAIESNVYSGRLSSGGNTACAVFDLVVVVIGVSILILIGLIGNSISMAVMWKDRNHSCTAFQLIALAIADDLVLLSYIPMTVMPLFCIFFKVGRAYLIIYLSYMAAYMWAVKAVIQTVASLLILQVAVHRYLCVCWPIKAKRFNNVKNCRLVTGSVVLFSVLFNVPRFFEHRVIISPRTGNPSRDPQPMLEDAGYYLGYKVGLHYLVLYIIPMTVLTFVTYKLTKVIRESRKKREQMTNRTQENNMITTTLISIVVIFLVCQLFIPLRRIIEFAVPEKYQGCPYFVSYFTRLTSVAMSINSATNFFAYCICSKPFRERVVYLFRKGQGSGPDVFDGSGSGTGSNLFQTKNTLSTTIAQHSAKVSPMVEANEPSEETV